MSQLLTVVELVCHAVTGSRSRSLTEETKKKNPDAVLCEIPPCGFFLMKHHEEVKSLKNKNATWEQANLLCVCRFNPTSRERFSWLLLNVARPVLLFIERKHVLVHWTSLVLFSAQAAGKKKLATTAATP